MKLKVKKGQKVFVSFDRSPFLNLLEGTVVSFEDFNEPAERYNWYTVKIGNNILCVEGYRIYSNLKNYLIDRIESINLSIEDLKDNKEKYEVFLKEKKYRKYFLNLHE